MTDKIDPEILIELIELGDRLTEDRLREIVIAELEGNEMDGVAQAYALEEADGDEKKARAYYTKHRVRRIRDMITQESILREEEKEKARWQENQRKADEQLAALNAKIKKEEEEKQIELQKAEEKAKIDKLARDKAGKERLKVFSFVFLVIIVLYWLSEIFG